MGQVFIRNLILIFLFSICFSNENKCLKILHQRIIQSEKNNKSFSSFFPDTCEAITGAFFIQKTCNPKILENSAYIEFGIHTGKCLAHAIKLGEIWMNKRFRYIGIDVEYNNEICDGILLSKQNIRNNIYINKYNYKKADIWKGSYTKEVFDIYLRELRNVDFAIINFSGSKYTDTEKILPEFFPYLRIGSIVIFDDLIRDSKYFSKWIINNETDLFLNLFDYGDHGSVFMLVERKGEKIDPQILEILNKYI
jgi:transcription termination factor NusB